MLTEKQRALTALRQQRFRERQQAARREEQAAKGLPALPAIPTMAGTARWRAALASARALVAQVEVEMACYYDARSETWQESDAGAQFLERQEGVEAILSAFDDQTF